MMRMMMMTLSLSKDAPGSYIYIFKMKNLHSLPPLPPFFRPSLSLVPLFPNDERTTDPTRPSGTHTERERERERLFPTRYIATHGRAVWCVGGCCATTTSTSLALAGGVGVGVGALATTTPTMNNDIDM